MGRGSFPALWWWCSGAVCRGPTRCISKYFKENLTVLHSGEGGQRTPPPAVGSEERSSAKYSCSSSLQRVSTWRLLMKHYSWFHRCRARLRRLHFSHTLMWHLVLAGQWNRFWVANKNTVPRRQLIIGYPGQKKKNSCQNKGDGRLFAQVVEDNAGSGSRWRADGDSQCPVCCAFVGFC